MFRPRYLSLFFSLGLAAQGAAAAISFDDVSVQSGVASNETQTWGAQAADINGDYHPDFFVANHEYNRAVLFEYQPDGTFADVSQQADASHVKGWTGWPAAVDYHGCTAGDIDNDGDKDLMLTISTFPNLYLQNDGSGLLYDITASAGTDFGDLGSRQSVLLDYNRDGRLDVAAIAISRNALIPQQSDGTFDPSKKVSISCPDDGEYANLADADPSVPGLELICAPVNQQWPGSVYGFQGSGDTTTVVNVTSVLPKVSRVNDVATGDFNGDGKPDFFLVIGSESSSGAAQANARQVETTMVTTGSNVKSATFQTGGVLTVEVNMRRGSPVDGDPAYIDIGSSGWSPSSLTFTLDPADSANWGLRTDSLGLNIGYDPDPTQQTWTIRQGAPDRSYNFAWVGVTSTENITNLRFFGATNADRPASPVLLMSSPSGYVDETAARGLDAPVQCTSAAVADFDNDMNEDIFLSCTGGAANIANVVYRNDGDGTFTLVPNAGGAAGLIGAAIYGHKGTSDSIVTADYDIDGYMDAFEANGLNLRPHGRGGPKQLFHNTGSGNHWLEFDLEGVQDNRDAIGAQVYVTAGGKTQYREQNGGYHRWSQNDMRIHLGLAGNTQADVRVVWPNGTEDTYLAVAADGLYRLTQGGAKTLLVDRSPGSSDTDGDGLTDAEEAALGTNPNVPDTDGGGVNDGDEVAFGTDPLNPADDVNNPTDACGEPAFSGTTDQGTFLWLDCDGSNRWHIRVTGGGTSTGLAYQGEIQSPGGITGLTGVGLEASDVLDTTTDPNALAYTLNVWNVGVDGIDLTPSVGACFTPIAPDLPVYLGVNRVPAVSSTLTLPGLQPCIGALDTDGDGLTDAEEAALGTNPNVPDTDGGGVNDGDEVAFGTDPLNPTDDVSIPADACGEPAFSGATDQGTFLWLDCDGSNRWHLRVTGGGTTTGLAYQGSILSQGGVADLNGFLLEGSDVLDTTTDPNALAYILNVWNIGVDGIDFTPSVDGCFTPIAPGLPVYLGVNRVPAASSTLSLTDLHACAGALDTDGDGLTDAEEVALGTNPNVPDTDGGGVNDGDEVNNGTDPLDPADDGNVVISVCGEPAFSNTVDTATFIWKDCDGSNQWHLRVTGGGTPTGLVYEGTVASPGGLTSLTPVSVEASDVLDVTTNPDQLSYQLNIWNIGLDGIDFVPTAGGCYTPVGPALPVYVGAARAALGTANLDLDLETASACN